MIIRHLRYHTRTHTHAHTHARARAHAHIAKFLFYYNSFAHIVLIIDYNNIFFLILLKYIFVRIIYFNKVSHLLQITYRDRFWLEHATNLWWQKGNKFHTKSVISDNVGKFRNITKCADILCQQIGFAIPTRFLLSICILAGFIDLIEALSSFVSTLIGHRLLWSCSGNLIEFTANLPTNCLHFVIWVLCQNEANNS